MVLKKEFEDVKKQLFTINEKYEELGKNNEDINKQLVEMSEKYEQLGKKNEEGKPKCFVCDKMFSTKKELMRHNRINHLKPDTFECMECEKSLVKNGN